MPPRGFIDTLFAPDLLRLSMEHLLLVFGSLAASIALGVPLGVMAAVSYDTGTSGIKDAKAKHEDAAKKKDWNQATLWAEQVWQYQVKAADLGLRAKTYLEQNGAKKVK